LRNAMVINGVWRNVCMLGVFDNRLWTTMDFAWNAILTTSPLGTPSRWSGRMLSIQAALQETLWARNPVSETARTSLWSCSSIRASYSSKKKHNIIV
ncbi:hypothetical protein NEOLEDRAFT_1077179, partial [Neolentinus lepideus HHB14362 ss-1]